MCGIAGFMGDRDQELLKKMTQALVHRGPDGEGCLETPDVSLGMRRLAIVDLEGGKQPVSNEDDSVHVVFNGEIYNHPELRKELEARGHRFRTHHSDTEVLVHLYEELGDGFVHRLNGMFAIALWDEKNKKLLLYRDRLGKKPLYYAYKNGKLAFASEIKSLLKIPWVSRELDPVALSNYFSYKHISAPRTAFQDIRQIPAGHYSVFQKGRFEVLPYWRLDFSETSDISEEEAAAEILRILDDSVARRMQCDVPFGAYLSGGIDSSSVVTLMSRHQSKPIQTFCLGYEDDFQNKKSDLIHARKGALRLGTDHHEYLMKAEELIKLLPDVLRAFDEPFSGTISTYFLSLLIKKHVKVALSGDGADELFGSYLPHRLAFPIQAFVQLETAKQSSHGHLLGSQLEALKPFDSYEAFEFLQQVADPRPSIWRNRLNVFSEMEKGVLLARDFHSGNGEDLYELLEPDLTAKDALNLVLETDQKELLPNEILPFVDRLSMAHSIEVRVPFLDYRLVEFVAKLPGHMKIREGVTKHLLKKAASKILPPELVHRPKEGFVLPVYTWLRTSLKAYVSDVLSETRVKKSGILSTSYVEQLVQEFFQGARTEAKIWNLICFQQWWENL